MSLTVMHVLHRFAVGGLENGVVNIINGLADSSIDHIVVSLTDVDPIFARRLKNPRVQLIELHKLPGKDLKIYWRMYQLLRRYRPDVIHTRNLSALDMLIPAFFARVPLRIHSEHGRDQDDADGNNKKNQRLRRLLLPYAHRIVALSGEIAGYLRDKVSIDAARIETLCNGVDCQRFHPAEKSASIGNSLEAIYVGRFQTVKNPQLVLNAFAQAVAASPETTMRLTMVGDGPLLSECQDWVSEHHLALQVHFAGASEAVDLRMREADVFLLGSNAEGISNTILEAMASGLPVIATDVGGNRELVADGESGFLVEKGDADKMAEYLLRYAQQPKLLQQHRQQARARAEKLFSLQGMLARYQQLYLANTDLIEEVA